MPDTFNWTGTLHAQFQGLLADIRTYPEDAGLRLILADWLGDHADRLDLVEADSVLAWARLMRLQCGREQSRGHPCAEEKHLLGRYAPGWLDTLVAESVAVEWRLGFVAVSGGVGALYAAIRGCDEGVFARVLWMQPHGTNPARGRHLEGLLGLPQLGGVGVLDLSLLTGLGEPAARALARSPHLAGLRHLNARGVGFGPAEFGHLAASAFLRPDSLDLGYNAAGDDGAFALADSPALASLRVLRLQRIGLTDDGAEALLASPHLANLRELSLYGNRDLTPAMAGRLEARFGLGFSW